MNEIKYKPYIEYILRSTQSIFEPMSVGSGGIAKRFSALENGKNRSLFTEPLNLSRREDHTIYTFFLLINYFAPGAPENAYVD